MFIFMTIIAVCCIMGLTVAFSYQAGLKEGYKSVNSTAPEKVIHMETIAIGKTKRFKITNSIDRKI